MTLKIVVTVKQVPDTQNVGADAMKPDGTVNRGALPAVFNPEDLNALEEAMVIKERLGAQVIVITMGPHKAVEVLKESLYRGADEAVLISDRVFVAADTLATSYALKTAVEKIGDVDLIICGRQAIDGDTAQVGPQIAEKLGINQLTGVIEVMEINDSEITVKRALDDGQEIAKSALPVLLTVTGEANEPRAPSAKRVMAYKNIAKRSGDESYDTSYLDGEQEVAYIQEWNGANLNVDIDRCGRNGSPTKVKKIQNVVLTAGEVKQIPSTKEGIDALMRELREEHIVG